MVAHPATSQFNQAQDGLTAASATRHSRLQRPATLIAKHCSRSRTTQFLSVMDTDKGTKQFQDRFSVLSGLAFTENRELRTTSQTKRPPGNLGGLFFQGRIVLTEVLSIRTFCGNLMSLKSAVSSKICDLNSLIFNNLHDTSTTRQTGPKWTKIACFRR